MKALISPNEKTDYKWISSWNNNVPVYSEISNCTRIAQVEPDDKTFEVAEPLFWVDCSDECVADVWYYKDGQILIKPTDSPKTD